MPSNLKLSPCLTENPEVERAYIHTNRRNLTKNRLFRTDFSSAA